MDLQLAGMSAIITGGSVGIGRAVAHYLASEGVNVCLAARSRNSLERTADEINAAGHAGQAAAFPLDTTSWVSVRQAVDAAALMHGRLDILVNGAAAPGGLVRAMSR